MLNARNLKLSFGSRIVLDDVSLSLLKKDKMALVGQNGEGKSSLLKILAGDPPDSGIVEISKDTRIGFLKQMPELKNDATVIEIVRSGMGPHLKDIEDHQYLCHELSNAVDISKRDKLIKQIDVLAERIETNGGFDVDYHVERVLTRLSINARTQKIETLSGGERRRVDLARILLMAPDIYLLDEPTNHLDVSGIEFLVETFRHSTAAILFISHDSAFVDDLATRIIELCHGKIYGHEPPFANYLENKLVRELIDARTLHRRERLVVGELAWLRAGTPARTTKQNARIDRAYELINQVARDNELQRQKKLEIESASSPRLGNTILEFENVGAAFDHKVLFRDFSLKVVAKKRYGILGPNGAGKSTLLSIIAQKFPPTYGRMIYGKNTEIIQFDQQREQLNQDATLKETLAHHGDYVRINDRNVHIASYLEKYLFSSGDANRRVSTLSGGEQNRLLLAKLFLKNANCLLLDEPTNDLDVTSLAVLEEILLDYEGVIFIVSHDRRFLDRVCTNIIAFERNLNFSDSQSKLVVYPGNYSDYVNLRAQSEQSQKSIAVKPLEKSKAARENPKLKTRRGFKEERELKDIETKIESLELERDQLHKDLTDQELFRSEPEKIQVKVERLRTLEHEIEKTYARWQELIDMGG